MTPYRFSSGAKSYWPSSRHFELGTDAFLFTDDYAGRRLLRLQKVLGSTTEQGAVATWPFR